LEQGNGQKKATSNEERLKIGRKEGDTLPSSLDYFQTLSQRWTLTITFLNPACIIQYFSMS
jgi:hypothetical protein